jgi:hypothetical protein
MKIARWRCPGSRAVQRNERTVNPTFSGNSLSVSGRTKKVLSSSQDAKSVRIGPCLLRIDALDVQILYIAGQIGVTPSDAVVVTGYDSRDTGEGVAPQVKGTVFGSTHVALFIDAVQPDLIPD